MQLDYDFFKVEEDNLAPRKGRILISEPLLNDSYFKRSVVFLTEYTKEGSVGFVLNKPINMNIKDVISDFPDFNTTIYVGGPVSKDTIHYIHTVGDLIPDSMHVKDDIYWGGDFDKVKELIREGLISPDQIRFFLGYSGWSPNQLDEEIESSAWLVSEVEGNKIMRPDTNLWKEILLELGSQYRIWINCPENPAMN
jgi:putative transcriptional regulator